MTILSIEPLIREINDYDWGYTIIMSHKTNHLIFISKDKATTNILFDMNKLKDWEEKFRLLKLRLEKIGECDRTFVLELFS